MVVGATRQILSGGALYVVGATALYVVGATRQVLSGGRGGCYMYDM